MRVGVNIVVSRPIGIDPNDFWLDFEVLVPDARPTNEAHPTRYSACPCKRRMDTGHILQRRSDTTFDHFK